MRQDFNSSHQWHDLESDSNTLGRSFFLDSGPGKNCDSSDQQTDNTRLPFKDALNAPPAPTGARLAPQRLSELWRQQEKAYHIILLIDHQRAKPLLKTLWHLSQRTVLRSDGYAMIGFRVRNLNALKPWLKHLEPSVQIIRTINL